MNKNLKKIALVLSIAFIFSTFYFNRKISKADNEITNIEAETKTDFQLRRFNIANSMTEFENLENTKNNFPKLNEIGRYDLGIKILETNVKEKKIKGSFSKEEPSIWNEEVMTNLYGERVVISEDKKSFEYTVDTSILEARLEDRIGSFIAYSQITTDMPNISINPDFAFLEDGIEILKTKQNYEVLSYGTDENFIGKEQAEKNLEEIINTKSRAAVKPFAAGSPAVNATITLPANINPISGAVFNMAYSIAGVGGTDPTELIDNLVVEIPVPKNIQFYTFPANSQEYTTQQRVEPDGSMTFVIRYNISVPATMTKSFSFTLKHRTGENPEVFKDGTPNIWKPEIKLSADNIDSKTVQATGTIQPKNTRAARIEKRATIAILDNIVGYSINVFDQSPIGGVNSDVGQVVVTDILPLGAVLDSVTVPAEWSYKMIDARTIEFKNIAVIKADGMYGANHSLFVRVKYPSSVFSPGDVVVNNATFNMEDISNQPAIANNASDSSKLQAREIKMGYAEKNAPLKQGMGEQTRFLINSKASNYVGGGYPFTKVTLIDDALNNRGDTDVDKIVDANFYKNFKINSLFVPKIDDYNGKSYSLYVPPKYPLFDVNKVSTSVQYKTNLKRTWTNAPGYPKTGGAENEILVSSFGLAANEYVMETKFEREYDNGNSAFPLDLQIFKSNTAPQNIMINGEILGSTNMVSGGTNKNVIRNSVHFFGEYLDGSGVKQKTLPQAISDNSSINSAFSTIEVVSPIPAVELSTYGSSSNIINIIQKDMLYFWQETKRVSPQVD